jgi:hypothetical protein
LNRIEFYLRPHDFLQNVTGLGGPDEGLGIFVVSEDEEFDGIDQLVNACEHPAFEPVFAEFSKNVFTIF